MTHRIAIARVTGTAPLSQSRFHNTPALEKEGKDAYAQRTWREFCHFDRGGNVVITAMAWKNMLGEAAKFLSIQIPGKGKATYTKHFEAGVMVTDATPIGWHRDEMDDAICEALHLPADGVRGSGKRVMKYYPTFPHWSAAPAFHVFDDTITRDVFAQVLTHAGGFIGLGRFRPRNNGAYGRFVVDAIDWSVP